MPRPPTTLREDHLSLEMLGALAREFDEYSAEDGGRTWPAVDFVRWLADEVKASAMDDEAA